jgi:YD repeat-containing protein
MQPKQYVVLFSVLLALASPLAAQQDTIKGGRFIRGSGTNAALHSLVIPFDFQRGLVCGESNGLAPIFLPYLTAAPLLYHYNATNPTSLTDLSLRIAFRNPIAAFGSRVGGSPLYIGQQYRFGVYAGDVSPFNNALVQRTWLKTATNITYLGAAFVELPYTGYATQWLQFQTNGYTQTLTTNGLTTIIGFENVFKRWDVNNVGSFVLTHVADASSSNKIYQFELTGAVGGYAMVYTGVGDYTYSPLYALEFEYRPPWRSIFVDQPHFEGEPVPSAYVGRSLEELLTNSVVAATFSLAQGPTTYTNLDQSPELRRHPILDQFVGDMRRDPVALARYVHNEIEVTDAISYNDNGNASEISVSQGGVSRGALATFQEGQGSPAEQCALLVYLLRQAGVSAVYVYPPHNGLKLLDTQISKLLRIQLKGALNDQTKVYTTNQLVSVNYPWVAAYIGTNWVHLFPWMKDCELTEGLNLYDFMPEAYNNGFKWMRDYALGRTNILGLSTPEDDTPLAIYPKFLQSQLSTYAPGVSLDDIGYKWRTRRKSYARWGDFPKPFVAPTNGVALDTLTSSAITNVFPGMTNIFDTVTVEAFSTVATNKRVFTGDLRLLDLHNRRMVLRHLKTGANTHNMILSLAAFRTNATGPTNFVAGDALLNSQQISTNLASTDDIINIRLTYKRHRALPPSVATNLPRHWISYPGLSADLVVTRDQSIRKGDLAAICIDVGRVSQPMLKVHAQEFWNMENMLRASPSATNSLSPDLYQGGTAFLMGMTYYERRDQFRELIERLHKQRMVSQFAHGVAHIGAKRVGGQLPNQGDIVLVQPKLDMSFRETVIVGNHTLHADSGAEDHPVSLSYDALKLVGGSAEEHHAIDAFLQQSNSISTVKLLQLAQQRTATGGSNVVFLNVQNHEAQGTISYGGIQLRNHDAALWAMVTNFLRKTAISNLCVGYVTPGAVTNSSNSYKGMGALLLSADGDTAALIGQNLNGGVGPVLGDSSFTAVNTPNYALNVDQNGKYSLVLTSPSAGNPALAPDAFADYNAATVINNATQNYYAYTPSQNDWLGDVFDMLGLPPGSQNQNFATAVQNVHGDSGFFSWLMDGLSQRFSEVADPVHAITGEFYVNATDLILPGPMPLEVNRNYSSLNLAHNQAGYGWKLNYMPYLSINSDATLIYAAEPDGAVISYQRTATNVNVYLPTTAHNPQLNNNTRAGIGSTANRLRNRIDKQVTGPDTFYYLTHPDGGKRTFKVLTFSGSVDRTRPYLLTWQDHRGNSFTFEYGGDPLLPDYAQVRRIQSSNGNYLGFYYDAFGHIVEAYSGDGRRLRYEYDRFGDLTKVIRPDFSTVEYEYEHLTQVVSGKTVVYSTHLLLRELKPDGRVLKNVYDQHRRVTNQWATVGADLTLVRNATFVYSNSFRLTNSFTNTITGYTLIIDVNNKTSRYDYASSLITNIIDQLGQNIEQYWYSDNATVPGYPRSLWKKKDQRGLWTEFQYDALGNVTTNITTGDLLGDGSTVSGTNIIVYNTNQLPVEVSDAVGNKTKTIYSTVFPFLPEQIILTAGNTAITTNLMSYYSVTNTFVSGGVTYTNLARGLLQQQVRAYSSPDAATNVWSHDGRGFPIQQVRFTATTDPAITNYFFYNDRGEMVENTDAAGRKTRFDHDGLGRQTAREVFGTGQSQPMLWEYAYYNENGELTWSDGPRFDPEDYVWRDYDGAGRIKTEIRWRSQARSLGDGVEAPGGDALFATTFRQYDAFGNLLRVTDPRGAVTTNIWDALGRLVQTRSLDIDGVTALATNGFGYEPGGLIRYHTNALGGVTETQYSSGGRPKYRRTPDGATNGWLYYLDGRVRREVQSNGAYWETTYQDSERTITKIFKTAAGTAQATNVSETDRRGNVIRRVDAGGFTFTNKFDGLDRIKSAMGPVVTFDPPPGAPGLPGGTPPPIQQVTQTFYDAAGVVVTNVNALGEKTITYSDALGRSTRMEIRNPANTLVREATTVYAANHHNVTVTNGSGTTAVAQTTFTDNDERTLLSITYPTAGVQQFRKLQYDLTGNLEFELDGSTTNGVTVGWSAAASISDGLNRLRRRLDRDDALTIYDYDSAGNLTNRAMPGGLKWQATYNTAGQMLQEKSVGTNGNTTRLATYGYYPSTHAYAGLLQTNRDGRGVVCTYIYDAFLRTATNSHRGPSPEHNIDTRWDYDTRGYVTQITESFTNAATGPSTTVTRPVDAYAQIKAELINVGSSSFSGATFGWDTAGRRSGLSFGQFNYTYASRADGLLASAIGTTGGGTYTYDTAGQLLTRTLGPRLTSIATRDGAGRPLSIITLLNMQTNLAETLTWTGDGLPASHKIERPSFTDQRNYLYADLSRRLTNETLRLDAAKLWTNRFTYDIGAVSGPGVLTRIGQPETSGVSIREGVDAFSRIVNQTNNVLQKLAYGRVNGPTRITAFLDGKATPVTVIGTGDSAWTNQWRTTLEMTPGTHQLQVLAMHPSGLTNQTATAWYTNNVSNLTATNIYDGAGNITQRVWKNPNGTTNLIQTLSWDAKGRLYKIVQRDGSQTGQDFTITYDAFGRRLRTIEITVTNGVAITGQPMTIDHYFDPQVEFLELAVTENGRTTWKILGPDFDGKYGGQNGTGGFDAIIPGPELFCPTIGDAFGNLHAVYDVNHGTLMWNSNRVTAYGAVPGYRPVTLGSTGNLVEKCAWRNRPIDSIGFVWMGANWYDPEAGRFLAFDVQGHAGATSDSGYDVFNGSPLAYWDSDGRFGSRAWDSINNFELPLPGVGGPDAQEVFNSTFREIASSPFELSRTIDEYASRIEIPAPGIGGPSAQDEFNDFVNGRTVSFAALLALDVANGPSGESLFGLLPRSGTTVYRVEGLPNTRIIINQSGEVTVQGEQMLFLNFNQLERAEELLARRLQQQMPGVELKSFEVPQSFLDDLRRLSVPESQAATFPTRALRVDTTRAPDQFGLRPDQIEELRRVLMEGSGIVH